MANPLLEHLPLPAFDRIQPEHVESAIDQVLNENREQISKLLQQKHYSWKFAPGFH